MTAEVRFYAACGLTRDGIDFDRWGSMAEPIKAASVSSGKAPIHRYFEIAASSEKALWQWSDTNGFTLMAWRIVGEGALYAATLYEGTVSASDLTPAGTNKSWSHEGRSCVGALCKDTEQGLTHASAAVVAGDTAGSPTLWADASKVLGVASKHMVKNTGTASVVVELLIVPK